MPLIKVTWFIVSCGALTAVINCLRGPIAHAKKHEPSAADARRQAHLLGGLWLIYPALGGLSPDGFGWLRETPSARLDFGSSAGFGLYAMEAETPFTSQLVRAAPMSC